MSPNLGTQSAEQKKILLVGDRQKRNLAPWMTLAALFGLDPKQPRRLYTWRSPGYHGGPYMPHQGAKECARRRKQMGAADAKR